jgi:hypothetical protein
MTSIDLGECEILLRNYYNLTNNKTLYMKKIDRIQEGMKIPKIEYYDTILKKLENIFTDKNYDTSELDNGKEEIIETGKITVTFTTTQNQKNNLFYSK